MPDPVAPTVPATPPAGEPTPPATPPATPPVATSGEKPWWAEFPEDTRTPEHETYFKKFKSPVEAIRSGFHAEKSMGGRVAIPKEDATPEEIEGFYSRLRPGKPEEYPDY